MMNLPFRALLCKSGGTENEILHVGSVKVIWINRDLTPSIFFESIYSNNVIKEHNHKYYSKRSSGVSNAIL